MKGICVCIVSLLSGGVTVLLEIAELDVLGLLHFSLASVVMLLLLR